MHRETLSHTKGALFPMMQLEDDIFKPKKGLSLTGTTAT